MNYKVFASLVTTAALLACSSSSSTPSDQGSDSGTSGADSGTQTIVALASANANLSSLVGAVERASLVTTLEGKGPFTVFAPTNAAFAALKSAGVDVTQLDVSTLTTVLENHVLSGADLAATVEAASTLTTLSGKLNVNVTGGTVYLNGLTQITQTDIKASNGVIHVIDSVLRGRPCFSGSHAPDPRRARLT